MQPSALPLEELLTPEPPDAQPEDLQAGQSRPQEVRPLAAEKAGGAGRRRRSRRRELFCPAHPEQRVQGTGRKYFLHLLTSEQLRQRGMTEKKARLVINAYPVLVLSNEWLEQLFCPRCSTSRWCHVVRHDRVNHTLRWAPRDLWEQVAHVDPIAPNPSVSEFSRREARRHRHRRADGRRWREGSHG